MKRACPSYNAATALVNHNLTAGRGDKVAVIDRSGGHTYSDLVRRINQFANAVRGAGISAEQRIMICLPDTVDFPVSFLGAIKAGSVAVPVNTLLTADDYEYLLHDSRAQLLVVSAELLDRFEPVLDSCPHLKDVWVAGESASGYRSLHAVLDAEPVSAEAAATQRDDAALWLYTSGTTGKPKGAIHAHSDLEKTAELYAKPILGLGSDDIVFSVPKLFFAYGLGNALTFPFAMGATSVLLAGRPTPEAVVETIQAHRPTVLFGVPTMYAMMLNIGVLPPANGSLRLCVSAGEALPGNVLKRWVAETGVEILDGIGSTEMLHIFISNRRGAVRPGSTGTPVDGYDVRIKDGTEREVADGEIGDLFVRGPTQALGYWNQREKSRQTFIGEWTRTGDKCYRDQDGYYVYSGRSDDLLKVGGIYVSPMEVENALMSHPMVAEAAVVGAKDADSLIKPKAYVTLVDGQNPSDTLAAELIDFVRGQLAEYKRPRWIEFLKELPKTATGKIQRFRLRD